MSGQLELALAASEEVYEIAVIIQNAIAGYAEITLRRGDGVVEALMWDIDELQALACLFGPVQTEEFCGRAYVPKTSLEPLIGRRVAGRLRLDGGKYELRRTV